MILFEAAKRCVGLFASKLALCDSAKNTSYIIINPVVHKARQCVILPLRIYFLRSGPQPISVERNIGHFYKSR